MLPPGSSGKAGCSLRGATGVLLGQTPGFRDGTHPSQLLSDAVTAGGHLGRPVRAVPHCAYFVAKSLVAAGLCHRALVQVAYAIGVSDPMCIYVNSYGTVKEGMTDDDLHDIVEKNFNFRPSKMIEELELRRPIYRKTSTFGHFGRNDPDFTWEKVKKLEL